MNPRVIVERGSENPNVTSAAFSPDGRWLAYTVGSTSATRRQVYIQSYPGPGERRLVSGADGSSPVWRPGDGRELYYVEDASGEGPLKVRVMVVDVRTTPRLEISQPKVLFEGPFRLDGPFRNFDVGPDGRFLLVREVEREPARITDIVLVQNWVGELGRRVPVN